MADHSRCSEIPLGWFTGGSDGACVPDDDGAAVHNGAVMYQPMLSLWDEPSTDHERRIVAHSTDRVAWLRARSRGVTATDAARLASAKAVAAVVYEKVNGSGFGGNAYTDHGRIREPHIARWVTKEHGIHASSALFHSRDDRRHLATPDGIGVVDGVVVLAEIKTTSSAWRSIPRSYLRQVWWQQYVLGAERTLLVWEQHDDFVPLDGDPRCCWVERDENEIHVLVHRANQVLDALAFR